MQQPKILLLGATGQVGYELERCLAPAGDLNALSRTSQPLSIDLSKPDQLREIIHTVSPDWIVNAAAYTAVDKAEEQVDIAAAINSTAAGIIAEEAKIINAGLIHYSTDYVFDGNSKTPFKESDETHPLNVYGETKLAGEAAIQAAGGHYLIFRTSWVYGQRGSNFLLTIKRLAREREQLRIVDDQVGAPTWCRDIAQATAQAICQLNNNPDRFSENSGLYHLSANGSTTWYQFATAVVEELAQKEPLKVEKIIPIATEEYPLPATRSKYSVLDNTKIKQSFGIYMPNWKDAMRRCLENSLT